MTVNAQAAIETRISFDPKPEDSSKKLWNLADPSIVSKEIIQLQITPSAPATLNHSTIAPSLHIMSDSPSSLSFRLMDSDDAVTNQMNEISSALALRPLQNNSVPSSTITVASSAQTTPQISTYTFRADLADNSSSRTWKPVKVYSLPEVSSLALLALGGVSLLIRRKHSPK